MDKRIHSYKRGKSLTLTIVSTLLFMLLLMWILIRSHTSLASFSISLNVLNITHEAELRKGSANDILTTPWILDQNKTNTSEEVFGRHLTRVQLNTTVNFATSNNSEVLTSRDGDIVKSDTSDIIYESELFLKPEEIFQLKKPILFDPSYKNPCFKVKVQYRCPRRIRNARNRRVNTNCRELKHRSATQLACLPYFILVGFTKCGTSDMCSWLSMHQDVRKPTKKELHYWDPIHKTHLLSDYIFNGFRSVAEEITNDQTSYSQLIAGECTPRTVWGAGMRSGITGAGGLPSVNVSDTHQLTPYRIAHVLPNLKIIVIMRNPVDRLWSHFFHNMRKVKNYAEYFHQRVIDGIDWMHKCTSHSKLSLKICSYGSNFYETYRLPNLQDEWPQKYGGAYKIRIGLYHVFLQDWLQAFPKENILFIQFEDYVKTPQKYRKRLVLPHLGLDAYADELNIQISQKLNTVKNKNRAKPSIDHMWPETMNLLKEFYKPHNERLAELLNDTKYLLWNE